MSVSLQDVKTTSNTQLVVFLQAQQMDQAMAEVSRVKGDINIATARPDMLEPNWGTLVQVGFDQRFTVDQYRNILLGLIAARIKSPSRTSIRKTVLAFAPTSTISIVDYFSDPGSFIGPDPSTFFTLNGTGAGNVWNNPAGVWTPGRLLLQLGFDQFGTQVQVTSVANEQEIQFLDFVPAALEFVRPAHQFLALIYNREIAGP